MSETTILIIEDQYDNRVIYREALRHAGYRVLEAVNGEEGLRLAQDSGPDLILMDLSMPVLDGWSALARLKQDPLTCEIPVIALSAHVVMGGDFRRAREAGFEAYLTKPIEPNTVVQEVRARTGSRHKLTEEASADVHGVQ